ncbi:FliA/WhiG family RNA polymerase sigma factor [Salirhabdus salicampi]|uniref:FliA/WhiG family RNA polymerase sigma factor n=1 Tax=Salirhabdus salicampi TaxID=476102 RepID=UPI0020C3A948|nr:FliA/WhiG family RNA polymerase sigma factor [Salirhabdus salicampi]MCP8616498.1 FliA/WhiG family RNA polymerase sigma factor [Salirhabdus salicampi]
MLKATSTSIETTWKKWQENRDPEAGNDLVRQYQSLVDYHVQRIAAHLPKNVSKQDIKSLGLMGLVDALEKFDFDRDLKFDTYASFRVRGAILDGLRKEDWLPRSIRDKAKQIETVTEEMEQQLNRTPTSEEVAKKVNMTPEEVEMVVKDSLFSNIMSIEDKGHYGDENKEGIGYTVPDQKELSPDQAIIKQENVKELAEAVKNLNEKEQLVVSLFYEQDLTLTEIGEILHLSTSRISQIHSRAIFKLKNELENSIR